MKRLHVESLPSEYVLSGGLLVDPTRSEQKQGEIWVRDGRVQEVCLGGSTQAPVDVPRVDLGGLVLSPGFVDVHVHFREPGQEYKEDIESGSRAAVAGGFTSVLMMPNTEPPLDNAGVVADVLRRARVVDLCDVHCAGALTIGRAGSQLAEYDDMKSAGARALTDDGSPVSDSAVMRRALEHAAMLGLVVITHSEDKSLSTGGHMHEGYWSTHLGIPGIPGAAEESGVARDLLLARETGAPIHVAHVSTQGSVDLLRLAKESWGLDVTAETAPHYLDLTDQALSGFSTNLKMNPPIRSETDRQAIVEAVVDGTLGVIATDHAPHAEMEKDVEFERAPFGIVGLETSFGVAHTQLVTSGKMTLVELVKRMSLAPAERFGLEAGRLGEGLPASFTLLDPEEKWQVRAEDFLSRSRNSPFLGRTLCGRVVATIFRGRVVHRTPETTRDAVEVV